MRSIFCFITMGILFFGATAGGGETPLVWHGTGSENSIISSITSETRLNSVPGSNSVSVAINPVYPQTIVAAANGVSGVETYYSEDGGVTWSSGAALPESRCQPMVGWGLIDVFGGQLEVTYLGSYGRTLSSRSGDNGRTWDPGFYGWPGIYSRGASDGVVFCPDRRPRPISWPAYSYIGYSDFDGMHCASDALSADWTLYGEPVGKGIAITTDKLYQVYYLYAASSPAPAIRVARFANAHAMDTYDGTRVLAPTHASESIAIPAMETRQAPIYVTASSDLSEGPFAGSIYAAWTDATAPASIIPEINHTQIHVACSRDGGETWRFTIPHPVEDVLAVDRFQPWLTVDEGGVVHLVYYDTQNSANRTGVDLYYTYSVDGAMTWQTPLRVSSVTSANLNDAMEWGLRNCVSAACGKVVAGWTDNREGPPDNRNVYVAVIEHPAAEPAFFLGSEALFRSQCGAGTVEDIGLSIGGLGTLAGPVTLGVSGLPAGSTADFSQNPVTPPGESVLSIELPAGVAPGEYAARITGEAPETEARAWTITLAVESANPVTAPELLAPFYGDPAAGFPEISLLWEALPWSIEYRVQVSESPDFSTLFADETVSEAAFSLDGVTPGNAYYWRVAANNRCGQGPFSPASLFIAGAAPGQGGENCADAIPIYTDETLTGTLQWALPGAANSCTGGISPELWFVYTAPEDGFATFNSCGSLCATSLGVYAACGGAALACSRPFEEEGPSCDGYRAVVSLAVEAGESYFIQLANALPGPNFNPEYRLLVTLFCPDNLIQNGSFETGSLSPHWTRPSGTMAVRVYSEDVGYEGGFTRTGERSAHFAGDINPPGHQAMKQTVTIPAAESARLQFFLSAEWTAFRDSGIFWVSMDGTTIYTVPVLDHSNHTAYNLFLVDLDVSAYADGGSHTLRFDSEIDTYAYADFFVDDICLTVSSEDEEGEVDTTPPVITLLGSAETVLNCGDAYCEPGAVAVDAVDGPLAGAIECVGTVNIASPGDYLLTYTVSDAAGNAAQATRVVTVVDTIAPEIILNGPAVITLNCGMAYPELGATASDNCTTSALELSINDSGVDTSLEGVGLVTYGVADASGNSTYVSRTVSVVGPCDGSWAHTADQDTNGLVNMSELLRVIQFFNSDGFHCDASGEDGYAPGPGAHDCAPHDSDYNPQNWRVGLSEILRLIQFFNSGGYRPCAGEGTEDGLCPGILAE